MSRRAPTIVIVALCIALVTYWVEAPHWLPSGVALIVGGIAIAVMGARDRNAPHRPSDDAEESEDGGWIAQELGGNGSAPGTYLLAFCALVAISLTGFHGAYALPAWSGLALAVAWGIANGHGARDDGPDS